MHVLEHTRPSQLFGCPYCEVWTNMLCAATQGLGSEGGTVKLAISLHCIPGLTHSEWAIPWDVLCTWVLDASGHQAACWMKAIRLALVSVVLGVSVKVRKQQEVNLPVSWGSKPQAYALLFPLHFTYRTQIQRYNYHYPRQQMQGIKPQVRDALECQAPFSCIGCTTWSWFYL